MTDLFPSELTVNSRSVNVQSWIKLPYTVQFLVLRKKLVSYFASIKRGVTIIINYENMLQLMTMLFLSKLRRK